MNCHMHSIAFRDGKKPGCIRKLVIKSALETHTANALSNLCLCNHLCGLSCVLVFLTLQFKPLMRVHVCVAQPQVLFYTVNCTVAEFAQSPEW